MNRYINLLAIWEKNNKFENFTKKFHFSPIQLKKKNWQFYNTKAVKKLRE